MCKVVNMLRPEESEFKTTCPNLGKLAYQETLYYV